MIHAFLLLMLPSCAVAQAKPISFSDALKPHLNKYNLQCDLEFDRGNTERGKVLFDSLVQNFLIGSRFDNYSFRKVGGGKTRLAKIKKPVFLVTYASWCVLSKGEIPALNKLSRKYGKQLQIVVLFWDKKENVRRIARKFGGSIKVCYANEAYRSDAKVVATLKHTLGFPTVYCLDGDLNVVDIQRGTSVAAAATYRESFAENFSVFNRQLSDFLVKKDLVREQLVISEE